MKILINNNKYLKIYEKKFDKGTKTYEEIKGYDELKKSVAEVQKFAPRLLKSAKICTIIDSSVQKVALLIDFPDSYILP